MILKIKLEKDQEKVWATDIFSVVGDVDFVKLSNVLDRIKYFVGKNQETFKNINNPVLFDITDNGNKYEYMLLGSNNNFISRKAVVEAVEIVTGMPVSKIVKKTREKEYIKARVVLFSALRYFAGMSLFGIRNKYNFNHATILHSTKKTLPSFLISKDQYVDRCVTELSGVFNDGLYYNVCKTGKFIDI